MLALISYETCEMLTHATVPVGAVGLIKEFLNKLADVFLGLVLIDGFVDLLLHIVFHFLVHFADDPLHITLGHFFKFQII